MFPSSQVRAALSEKVSRERMGTELDKMFSGIVKFVRARLRCITLLITTREDTEG